jgi:hypothetical protein
LPFFQDLVISARDQLFFVPPDQLPYVEACLVRILLWRCILELTSPSQSILSAFSLVQTDI